jgi:hypothetical protein
MFIQIFCQSSTDIFDQWITSFDLQSIQIKIRYSVDVPVVDPNFEIA